MIRDAGDPYDRPARRVGAAALAFGLALVLCGWAFPAPAATGIPRPSPSVVIGAKVLRTPPVDAVPLCIPSSLGRGAVHRARAAARYPDSAWELAESLRAEVGDPDSANALLIALLMARAAETPEEARAARDGLRRWRRNDRGPERQACARLETARLELRLRHLPEAVAHARIASGLSGRIPGGSEVQRAGDFYAAEGLYLAGREEEARAAYRRLSGNASPRLAAAARLRFADALFDSGQRKGAQVDYAELLERAEEFGASIQGWGLRALEATLEQGDLAGAKRWAEAVLSADPSPAVRGATRIRVGDLLIARGDVAAAHRLLERIVGSEEALDAVRTMAQLRIEHTDPDPADAERVERLRELGRHRWRPAADYARLLLARDLMALGDATGAVDALSRVAFGPLSNRFSALLREAIDGALGSLAMSISDPEGCADYVAAIGWRRKLLIRRASDLTPFAELGNCYAMLGLEQVAIDVYREVARRFGAEGAARVALALARASLSRGEIDSARRAAIAHVNRPGDEADRWRLLHAEIEMFEGRYGTAAETLRALVEKDLPEGERARAIVLLARAASHLGRLSELRFVIGEAVLRLSEDERRVRGDWVGEAALLAADGHRTAGNVGAARDLYAIAIESLPAGERRDQASYWLTELGGGTKDRAQWSGRGPSSWRRLAETRRSLKDLERRIDAPAKSDGRP